MSKKSTDFIDIINKLKSKGLTNERIARLTGTSASSIDRIRNRGSEPRYSVGEKLIELSKNTLKNWALSADSLNLLKTFVAWEIGAEQF